MNQLFTKWENVIRQELVISKNQPDDQLALKNLLLLRGKIKIYHQLLDKFINAYNNQEYKKYHMLFEYEIEPLFRKTRPIISSLKKHAENKAVKDIHEIVNRLYLSAVIAFSLIILLLILFNIFGYKLTKKIIAKLFDLIKKLKAEKNKVLHLEKHDALTNLSNRIFFNEKLAEKIKLAPFNERIAIIFIDINKFKMINDSYGYNIGDMLLKNLAFRLHKVFKDDSTLSRLSGDEFAIIVNDAEKKDIKLTVHQLLNEVNATYFLAKKLIHLSVSIGIAFYPDDAHNSDDLIQKADIALLEAKKYHNGNYQFYTSALGVQSQEKYQIEIALNEAIDKKQLYIKYQPIVSSDHKLVAIEALLRWKHPELGMISPDIFIPIAEESGLIKPIGEWVIKQACYEFSHAYKKNTAIKLYLNTSVKQLTSDFADMLMSCLNENLLQTNQIEIELTETAIMNTDIDHENLLCCLSKLGINVAIDDFGTGYSSLARLRLLPISTLKIDRSFIQSIAENINEQAIVVSILKLSESLNINVIAEGIETKKQLNFLVNHGCHLLQGYYFSKPLTIKQLKTWEYHHINDHTKSTN